MGLPDGEDIVTLALFVLTQYQRVTDGEIDRRTDTRYNRYYPRYHSVALVKNKVLPELHGPMELH